MYYAKIVIIGIDTASQERELLTNRRELSR